MDFDCCDMAGEFKRFHRMLQREDSTITKRECPSKGLDTHQLGISSTAKIQLVLRLCSPDAILRASIGE